MERHQAIEFLLERPADFAKLVGFDKLNALHNCWIVEMLRGREDKTLQASRGTYKTTCVSVALALTCVLLPNRRTLFMRKTDGDVKEVIRQVQKILLDPHTQYFVQSIYGANLRLVTASTMEISTNLTCDAKGTAQLVGIGTKASLTGKHFDAVFTDDIVNIKDRVSKAERDQTKLVYQELQNIKNRGANCRIFNTGTPWHIDDAFSIMPAADRYDCYHPEIAKVISAAELEEIRTKMVPSLFAANYELRFVASDDVIFTNPQIDGDPALVEQGDIHIDASYGGEDGTALTAFRKHGGKYYIYGRLWQKHVDDCVQEIIELRKHFNAGRIFCEDNGDKGYLAKDLRKRGERVVTYHEKMNKYIKITSYLKSAWKDVIFIAGTDKAYINQICDYNEDAEHDDAPDSAASAVRRVWGKGESDYPLLW